MVPVVKFNEGKVYLTLVIFEVIFLSESSENVCARLLIVFLVYFFKLRCPLKAIDKSFLFMGVTPL